MERLLELSTDPEFLSQLDSFKEKKAVEVKAEYKDKITALENEIQNIRAELNAKLSALGVNIEKSPKRRSSKNNTRRTKEATQELLTRVKDLIRQHPGITAGEISAQINETASPLLSRLKSEGHVRPTGKGRGTTWNLA
jgi:F0F1-type ATP synthase membrane subunit b/b'